MKKLFGVVLGALLIAGGVLYAFDVLNIVSFDFSLDGWWTMFIIIPSLYSLLTSKDKSGSIIALAIGVFLLLAARDIIDFDIIWKLILPVIAIVIGIKLIAKVLGKEKPKMIEEKIVQSEGVFKENEHNSKICAVFGGTKCNLSDLELKDGSEIDLLCVCGGAEITVPENVEIKTNNFCLFGGISDKRPQRNIDNPIKVTINGCCIFGGAEIK